METKRVKKSKIDVQILSASAVFGALSAVLTFVPSLRFPILPYLRFELAELPVMVGTFIYGPVLGIISSFAYWIILNFIGEFQPYGPFMKFLSVLGMIIGTWIGVGIIRKLKLSASPGFGLILSLAAFIRIVLMSMLNYIMLLVLLPSFLDLAANSLSASLGLKFQSSLDAMILIVIFTGIFNLIHTILSMIPAYSIVKVVFYKRSLLRMRKPWISSVIEDTTKSNSSN